MVFKQSWKAFLLSYIIGVITIPLLGFGLYWIWKTYKKQGARFYKLTQTQAILQDPLYVQKFDLLNIEDLSVSGRDLTIQTPASEMVWMNLENATAVKELIEQYIEAEKERNTVQKEVIKTESEYDPGSLDRIDYLTGLWQQGLITDEEYDKERKHF